MVSKEEAKQKIAALVQEFERDPRKDKLTEEETKEYIKALFEALGWNTRSDMRMEEQISRKFVDYGFRLNDLPVLYLEAKKSSVSIQEPQFVEQAIDYAWHKATTWAVLTNFKELRIFNSYIKESTQAAQLRYLYMNEYVTEFDSLWLLSKESFETKLIDKVAEKEGKKAREKGVVKQLFEDLNKWREILAKDIKKEYSSKYSAEEIDEMIQLLLDRLILIRRIEDENLESRRLEEIWNVWADGGKNLWKSVQKLFREFDESYNSKIFSIHELDKIEIGDQTLKFLPELYQSRDKTIRYNFAFIDADILGNIYEQYLGYLLKTTAKRATGEESKSKRKEQGIYYTPRYIVDYIVKNTLGEKLKACKTRMDVEKIKVLDPSCGSGSFLIRAFDEIYDYYEHKGWADNALLTTDRYKDTETVKDRIIKNNIFGVDLDSKAVEIAQLNLLLKTTDKKHKLPTLQDNIKSGNSLISDQQVAKQPFDWGIEFREVLKNGGFDVIIGNPPYISWTAIEKDEKRFFSSGKYLDSEFSCRPNHKDSQPNYYLFFLVRAANLMSKNGVLSFIIPQEWLFHNYAADFRKYLANTFHDIKIIKLNPDYKVFKGPDGVVGTNSLILLLKKDGKSKIALNYIETMDEAELKNQLLTNKFSNSQICKSNELFDKIWDIKGKNEGSIRDHILSLNGIVHLSDKKFFEIKGGFQPPIDRANLYEITQREYEKLSKLEKEVVFKLVYDSNEIKQYFLSDINNRYWIVSNNYLTEKQFRDNCPTIFEILSTRIKVKKGKWWHFPNVRNLDLFCKYPHKILSPRTASQPSFAFDENRSVFKGTNTMIISKIFDPYFILGILNSSLSDYWYTNFGFDYHGSKSKKYEPEKVKKFSLPIFPATEHQQKRISELAKKAISISSQINNLGGKITSEKNNLERQLSSIKDEIDTLVDALYKTDSKELNKKS